MDKWTVARNLREIANYLEITEENPFKASAFANAARSLDAIDSDLASFISSGAIDRTKGIGKATKSVILELAQSGRSSYLEELRAQFPPGFLELVKVPGLGTGKIRLLHETLGISTVEDLEAAAREGQLAGVKGFGSKTASKILEGIEQLRSASGRMLLPRALQIAEPLARAVQSLKHVSAVEVCGAIRRRLEVIESIVICAASRKPERAAAEASSISALDFVASEDNVVRGVAGGMIPAEIHFVNESDFGAAVAFLTGGSEFVDALSTAASRKSIELSARGATIGGAPLEAATEYDFFRAIGKPFVEAEIRESGEPLKTRTKATLVSNDDLRGTFHVHTTYSDGRATLEQMLAAAAKLGYSYVGISDHSKAAAYAGGLTEPQLDEQRREIDSLREKFAALRIFRGIEADILQDGSIDYGLKTLATFDFVVASVHSRFKMDADAMTERIVTALSNPFVTFLGHMSGRLLLSRPPYGLDVDKVFAAAAKHGVMIEINGSPHRLDIDWRYMQKAADAGITFSIHPDAHSVAEYDNVLTGTWAARKGALAPEQIFNTRDDDEVGEYLDARRKRAIKLSGL